MKSHNAPKIPPWQGKKKKKKTSLKLLYVHVQLLYVSVLIAQDAFLLQGDEPVRNPWIGH